MKHQRVLVMMHTPRYRLEVGAAVGRPAQVDAALVENAVIDRIGEQKAPLGIGAIFDVQPKPGTAEGDRFDVLATLIEAYEEKHWPIDPSDPVDAIQYRMEQAGLGQADLARLLGSRSRASEIMRRKRSLTMEQALKLHEEWKIPAEALLRPSLKETA